MLLRLLTTLESETLEHNLLSAFHPGGKKKYMCLLGQNEDTEVLGEVTRSGCPLSSCSWNVQLELGKSPEFITVTAYLGPGPSQQQYPAAAVTNDHKRSGLKQQFIILYSPEVRSQNQCLG